MGLFVCCWLRTAYRIRLPGGCNCGVASSPLRCEKRWVRVLWHRQFYDDRAVLFDVVAVSGPIFFRLAITRSATETSGASGVLAARPSAPLVCYLFFQRPDQMPWQRLVEWLECVARSYPPTIQHH